MSNVAVFISFVNGKELTVVLKQELVEKLFSAGPDATFNVQDDMGNYVLFVNIQNIACMSIKPKEAGNK